MKRGLAIIGAGNMGAALCKGLIEACPDLTVSIADRNEAKLAQFSSIRTSVHAKDIIKDAEWVMIAVKPQSFDEICGELDGLLSDKVILSIMAGKTLETLAAKTGSLKVIRSMPNLGARVGRGMTAWIASSQVTKDEAENARRIFRSVGKEMCVKNEEDIDRFSVIAGCGPAYFFRLYGSLAREAERLGFSTEEARQMAAETFIASAQLIEQEAKKPDEWVKAVASKGGVTEAALKHLAQSDIDTVMSQAIDASLKRSKELNG